ncbi:hypothetical protein Landi51_00970 [Colletotrichum acutatum]
MDSTTTIDVSMYDNQLQCPLFGILPGEIRNEIFALALVQFSEEEGGAAYPKDSYWYRPGFTGPRKSSSSLLRAYRGPAGRTRNHACEKFFSDLTEQRARDLNKVRFFTQMYWLEDGRNLARLFAQPKFRPEVLTITVRYSDWWYWESDEPLRMKEDWLRGFRGPRGLRELRVEYETLVGKREEMMRIVGRNKGWKLVVGGSARRDDGRGWREREREDGGEKGEEEQEEEEGYLSAEGTELVEWTWKGASKLGGQTWAHHGEGETVEYVVVMDTWRFVEGRMSEEDWAKRVESRPLPSVYAHPHNFWWSEDEEEEEEEGEDDDENYNDDEEEEEDDD